MFERAGICLFSYIIKHCLLKIYPEYCKVIATFARTSIGAMLIIYHTEGG